MRKGIVPIETLDRTFRCFLIRLGFIGNEYQGERKILLSRLSESATFKEGKKCVK